MTEALERSLEAPKRRFRPYPDYRDSRVEWLGEIPGHWELKRLKYLASINDEALPEDTDPNLEISYVDIGNVDSVAGIVEKEALVFEDAPSRARRIVRDGDLIVSTVRTYLRAIAAISDPEPNLIVSTGFAVVRPKELETSFNAYAVRAPYFVDRVVANSVGVSYPSINASEVACFPIAYPEGKEQRAIAAFLDRETAKIDALVAKKERLIELLQEKRTALITRAVTKGLPAAAAAQAGLDPSVPMKDSGVNWLGETPAHWTVMRLKSVAPLQGGYAFKSESYGTEGIPVVRMNNLRRGALELAEAARVPESECLEDFSLKEGDLLLGMSGSLGETGSLGNYAIVRTEDLPSQLNQRVGRFKISYSCFRDFLLFFMASAPFTEPLLSESTGTAQFNISPESVGEVKIGLPPMNEQERIADFLFAETAKIDALVARVRRGIDDLKEFRTALISAAVTGKIDVREEVAS